jgi:hypothetical protein
MIDIIPLKYNSGWPRVIEREDIKIVKAAIRQDDKVYTGWRHAEIMYHMKEIGCKPVRQEDDKGFIDQMGHFYRRSAAGVIVRLNKQVTEFINQTVLTSEDLWDNEGNPL